MELLPLSDFTRLLKQRIVVPLEACDKRCLDAVLVDVLTEFFTAERLCLNPDFVRDEVTQMRSTEAEMVLAKLRSLLEKQARKDIGAYCSTLSKDRRIKISAALHQAGIHHFRENLETDLYVGIHTAISANFKMMGMVFSNPSILPSAQGDALGQLFRALSYVAAQPLGVLFALEGVFWDRGLYALSPSIVWHEVEGIGAFYLDKVDIERRLDSAVITEMPMGCPAMRARTPLGERVLEFVQRRCLEVAERFYLKRSVVA